MKTTKFKIFAGVFIFAAAIFTFTSCSVTEAIEAVNETVEEVISDDVISPLQRIYQCSLDARGNVVVSPITDGTIANKNVHVITHGWAPGYRSAVNEYYTNTGKTLLAWQPEAISGGERFFVGSFFPLAKSILKADRGSAVLVFSWIDISASDVSFLKFLEGEDYDQFCAVEKQTRAVGMMLMEAVDAALTPHVPHELHLLGHSFGTKVVSYGGIFLKRKNYLNKIHITLFDSPEKAPADCGDNKLCEILPSFSPDRDKYFVDNYISYWDECFSDCHDTGNELHLVVDATIIPYGTFPLRDSCTYMQYQNCASCKHSAGVNWYTAATNDPSHESGLWWSPLMGNLIKTGGLQRYYLKPSSEQTKIHSIPGCGQNEIVTCLPVPLEEEEK